MKIVWNDHYRYDRLIGTVVATEEKTEGMKRFDVISSFNDVFTNQIIRINGHEMPCVGEERLLNLMKIVRRHINDHVLRVMIDQCSRERVCHSNNESLLRGEAAALSNGCIMSKDANNNSCSRDSIDDIITDASKKYDVNADLVRAIIKTESDFNVTSTSAKGAMGLMQLMPETAKDMGVENAFDPRENIMGGTRYLKMLLNRYGGDIDLALSAYNWGMGNVEKHPERLPEETASYIVKVKKQFSGSLSQRHSA